MDDNTDTEDPWSVSPAAPFTQNPVALGALLSAGGALAGPQPWGGTPMFALQQALGSAGESVRNQQAMQQKETEVQSKAETRSAQADAASERALRMGDRIGIQEKNLELRQQAIDNLQTRNKLGNIIKVQNGYDNAIKTINRENALRAKRNNDVMRPQGQPPEPMLPIPTREEWLANNPEMYMLYHGTPAPSTPTADTSGGDTSTEASGTGTSTAPVAPTDPNKRAKNQIYSTPKGDLRWTGTGWVKP